MIKTPAFRNPDFRRLWAGVAGNHLGMSGEQVIVGLLVYRITESTAWVGVALALYFLPRFVFGALSGAVADGMDRRTLLRRTELAIAANLALFAGLAAAGFAQLWPVLTFTTVAGTLRALHQPVRISYAYDIAGGQHIVGSLGLLSLGTRLGQLIGGLLAGSVMQRIGAPGAFLALAIVHVMAFWVFCRLESTGIAETSERGSLRRNLGEFFTEMRGNRVLAMLVIVTASVEVFGFSFATALPELATRRFDLGAEGLGLMQVARAVGGLIASLALSALREPTRHGATYLTIILAFGMALMLLSFAGQFVLALGALVLVAAVAASSDVFTQSMMQLSVPNRLRGRAMGAWVLAIGFAPIGHLEMGTLAVSLGVGGALFANGIVLIGLGVLASILVPRLRRL